jgi:hypothetical protein
MNDDDEVPDPFDHLPEGHPSRSRSYEVGKNRPPVGGRFPPGKSGNPKGKKKGKHVATQVREAFTALRTVSIGGRQCKLPTIVALVHLANAQAFKGDKGAMALNFSLAARLGVLDEPPPDGSEPPDDADRQIIDNLVMRRSRQRGQSDD